MNFGVDRWGLECTIFKILHILPAALLSCIEDFELLPLLLTLVTVLGFFNTVPVLNPILKVDSLMYAIKNGVVPQH